MVGDYQATERNGRTAEIEQDGSTGSVKLRSEPLPQRNVQLDNPYPKGVSDMDNICDNYGHECQQLKDDTVYAVQEERKRIASRLDSIMSTPGRVYDNIVELIEQLKQGLEIESEGA